MRKNVRELLHAGYYNGKSIEDFTTDAVVWAGEPLRPEDETRMRGIVATSLARGESRDKILDRLCDDAHLTMLL